MRHMKLFQCVDAVVREGSVRRAADKMFLTPSAIDRRIQDLEEDLGVDIFERHARGMRLTAAGEVLIGYVRRHLSDVQRLQSEIDGLNGLRRGHVRVAISPALAVTFMPHCVNSFRQTFPQVTFDLHVAKHGDAIRALVEFDVDLVVITMPPRNPDVVYLAVSEQPLMAVMDRAHPLAGDARPIRVKACAGYPLVIPGRGLISREMLDTALNRLKTDLNIVAETNSYEIMRGLVRSTTNISFEVATMALVATELDSLFYRPVSAADIRPVPLVCAQLNNRRLSMAATRFSHHISHALNALDRTGMNGAGAIKEVVAITDR